MCKSFASSYCHIITSLTTIRFYRTDALPDAKLTKSVNDALVFTGRIAGKRQTAGVGFTQRPKISIFAPQGRLVAPIYVKFGKTERHMGPLGRTKFHANW